MVLDPIRPMATSDPPTPLRFDSHAFAGISPQLKAWRSVLPEVMHTNMQILCARNICFDANNGRSTLFLTVAGKEQPQEE